MLQKSQFRWAGYKARREDIFQRHFSETNLCQAEKGGLTETKNFENDIYLLQNTITKETDASLKVTVMGKIYQAIIPCNITTLQKKKKPTAKGQTIC